MARSVLRCRMKSREQQTHLPRRAACATSQRHRQHGDLGKASWSLPGPLNVNIDVPGASIRRKVDCDMDRIWGSINRASAAVGFHRDDYPVVGPGSIGIHEDFNRRHRPLFRLCTPHRVVDAPCSRHGTVSLGSVGMPCDHSVVLNAPSKKEMGEPERIGAYGLWKRARAHVALSSPCLS